MNASPVTRPCPASSSWQDFGLGKGGAVMTTAVLLASAVSTAVLAVLAQPLGVLVAGYTDWAWAVAAGVSVAGPALAAVAAWVRPERSVFLASGAAWLLLGCAIAAGIVSEPLMHGLVLSSPEGVAAGIRLVLAVALFVGAGVAAFSLVDEWRRREGHLAG